MLLNVVLFFGLINWNSSLCLLGHNSPTNSKLINKNYSARTVRRCFQLIYCLTSFFHNFICSLHFFFCIIHNSEKIGITRLKCNIHMVTHYNSLIIQYKFRMVYIIFLIFLKQRYIFRVIRLSICNHTTNLSIKCLFIHLNCFSAISSKI